MNFEVKTEQPGDETHVISLAGEDDLYTAPEFKQQLLDVISRGGKNVVVDFSDTTFIDSTTLGVLVGGVKRLRANERLTRLVTEMQSAYGGAKRAYVRIARVAPEDPSIQLQLADAAVNSGDTATALRAYRRFLALAPDDPSAPLVRQEVKRLESSAAVAGGGGG